MEYFVIRSEVKEIGTCYHGRDGVVVRSPLEAVKYKTFDDARKYGGDAYYYNEKGEFVSCPYEIVPVTIHLEIHDEDAVKIMPEIEEASD